MTNARTWNETRAPAGARNTDEPELATRRPSVLVVDDHTLSAKLARILLEHDGFRVALAASAEDALALLATFRPDVAVIDLALPRMSGLALARLLKSAAATRELVLVAVTAMNGSELEHAARAAGFTTYLRKPIDPTTFGGVVSAALGGVS